MTVVSAAAQRCRPCSNRSSGGARRGIASGSRTTATAAAPVDVFFRSLRADAGGGGGREAMPAVLDPFVRRRAPEHRFLFVDDGDGDGAVYLGDGHSTRSCAWAPPGRRSGAVVTMPER